MWLSTDIDAWLAGLPLRPLKGDAPSEARCVSWKLRNLRSGSCGRAASPARYVLQRVRATAIAKAIEMIRGGVDHPQRNQEPARRQRGRHYRVLGGRYGRGHREDSAEWG